MYICARVCEYTKIKILRRACVDVYANRTQCKCFVCLFIDYLGWFHLAAPLRVCVCVCACACACMYVCVCMLCVYWQTTSMFVCMYASIYLHTHTWGQKNLRTRAFWFSVLYTIYTCIHIYVELNRFISQINKSNIINLYIHKYIYKILHIYISIYTYLYRILYMNI